MRTGWTFSDSNHALCQQRNSPDKLKLYIVESRFRQQCGQGLGRPEFDMPMFPKDCKVGIQFPGDCERQVLKNIRDMALRLLRCHLVGPN